MSLVIEKKTSSTFRFVLALSTRLITYRDFGSPSLKSTYTYPRKKGLVVALTRMGATLTTPGSSKLEAEMVEAMRRRAEQGTSLKSINSIILKFPKIDEDFRKCKAIFEEFDEDKNGVIDMEELKHSFGKLEVSFTEEEFTELFHACDINDDMGINFNEFVVLLCLVYLLKGDTTSAHLSPHLEATFETLVDVFAFLDKNKDGYVSKSEMVEAIHETTSGERSSGRIAMRRFEEMDWDRNGMVNFKEFLFAITSWVGINEAEDEDEDEAESS